MSDDPKRPILLLLTSHWISMLGVALVTLAGVSWLFVLPASIRGHVNSPYIGILAFIAIPVIFVAGLAFIPVGIFLGKRRVAAGLAALQDTRVAWRRAAIFFVVMTAVNVVIASQGTYRAVGHMETVQFCGQSCHVMKPEFTGHLVAPHQEVPCVGCHVSPGASGWVASKVAGTRQLMGVIFNNYPRPIESAMESNRLVPASGTCEQCHERERVIGSSLRVISKFNDDESNTRTETVLTMLMGGGRFGGIHGAHLGPGVHIRYAAADKKRQTIPWVEYRNTETGVTRTYLAADTKPGSVTSLPTFEMQCVDCHNRAAHAFQLPDRAVDQAIARGEVSVGLPFVKKVAVELLKADYRTGDEAAQRIPAALSAYYQHKYPAIANQRATDIQAAGQAVNAIYQRNVFPDLKVTWGTYPNNLGHADFPGCFRCHDENHSTSDKKTITQDCTTCHQALAVEETSPAVLTTLGIADRLSEFEKK
jgi:hypothetical protein